MSTGKIFTQIPKVMGDVGHIAKGRKNTQQNYAFRGIDDVYSAFQGPLSKHGVFYAPNVVGQHREERQTKAGGALIYTVLTVEFAFYADDGSSFKVTTIGEAMDSGDKSSNKAMSAALKYALLQVFCIPTEEDNDIENHSPEPVARVTPKPLGKSQPVQKSAAGSGALCLECQTELILSKSGAGYYCPNFKQPAPKTGEHTRFKISELNDFLAHQADIDEFENGPPSDQRMVK